MNVKSITLATVVLGLLFPVTPVMAEDEVITIEGTRIRGNQELPTILYLIPWQPPEVQQLSSPEQTFAIQRPLEPLERQEFKRLITYHEVFLNQSSAVKSADPEQ